MEYSDKKEPSTLEARMRSLPELKAAARKAADSAPPQPVNWQGKAETRVRSEADLLPYQYVLIDDPLLFGPIRFEAPPNASEKIQLEKHYQMVCSAPVAELEVRALSAEKDFIDILENCLDIAQGDGKLLLTLHRNHDRKYHLSPVMEKDLEKFLTLLQKGQQYLEKFKFTEAAGIIWHTKQQIEKLYSDVEEAHNLPEKLSQSYQILYRHQLIRLNYGHITWLTAIGSIRDFHQLMPDPPLLRELCDRLRKPDGKPVNYKSVKNNDVIKLPETVRNELEAINRQY